MYSKKYQAAFYSSSLALNLGDQLICLNISVSTTCEAPGYLIQDLEETMSFSCSSWRDGKICQAIPKDTICLSGATHGHVLALSLSHAVNVPDAHGAGRSMGEMCCSVAATRQQVGYCNVAEKTLNYYI